LTASASNHHVTLSWTAAAGAGSGGYRVLRSTSATGPFSSVGTASGTSFTDKLLANNTPYYYVAHTIGGTGESGDSNTASATPFIEICAVDASSYAVSVFDGTANGNVAPKRSFGWGTGIAESTGIGTNGTNIYVASKYTQTINIYPRASATGNTAPTSTITLLSQPTALTVDAASSEVYVAIGSKIYVYSTIDSSLKRALTVSTGTIVNGITGIQVYHSATVNQTFVILDNKILVYNNGDNGTTAPQTTIIPQNTTQFTKLAGPAYDPTNDVTGDAIFVGWRDGSSHPQVASYARTGFGVTAPKRTPITQGGDPAFFEAIPGGIVLDVNDLWIASGGSGVSNSALLRFLRTDTGAAAPSAGFVGANTHIYKPGPLALDASGELWFVNGKNGAAAFLKTSTTVNSAPAKALSGEATGLYDPVSFATDRVRNEIVVLNQSFWNPSLWGIGNGHAINSYSATPGSPVTPKRTIAGALTTLDGIGATTVAVDEMNGEYWIDDHGSNNGFIAFASSPGGNVAPARTIVRNVSLGSVSSMFYDATAAQILATATVAANNWTVSGWNRLDSGNVAADRLATLTPLNLASPAIDYVHDLLFMFTDSSVMSVFPRGFGSGTLTANSTVNTTAVPGNLSAVDGEGDELYFWTSNQIMVAPRPTGTTLSLARTISGSATRLYNTLGLAICN
jgi:hypothetical protein